MDGYDKLSVVMGTDAGMEIFRRFATLNAKTLLYLQAELIHLEAELNKIALEDSQSDDQDRKEYQYNVLAMKESVGRGDDLQWKQALKIRETLQQYSKALKIGLTGGPWIERRLLI